MAKFELRRLTSYDAPALLAEIRRVAELIPGPHLRQADFNRLAKCSSSVVHSCFGSWQAALSAAGLAVRYSGGVGSRGRKQVHFSDEDLLTELRLVSEKLGGTPVTIESFQRYARMNAETIRRRFGSWGKALDKAGLRISSLGRRYSDDDYFENLLTLWTYYGRQPSYGEMNRPPSRIPAGAYEAKWGTWRNALKAFLERVNADMVESHDAEKSVSMQKPSRPSRLGSSDAKQQSPLEKTRRRSINLGLRYDVLRRDRFRCTICGASPASKVGCELHVDHITPVALGGRTTLDNLRTLCNECNIGKGAKVEHESSIG